MQEDQLWHWLIKGMGGLVAMAEQWARDGHRPPEHTIQDMEHLQQRLARLEAWLLEDDPVEVTTPPAWEWTDRGFPEGGA